MTTQNTQATMWLDQTQQRAWRAYITGTTALLERLDRDLREEYDLSLPEYEILVRLSEATGHAMRMAELASSISHSRSRVTHTVSRMERAGLVRRQSCPTDGRGVIAGLTENGWQTLQDASHLHVRGVREHLVDLVDGQDLVAVGRAFDIVMAHLTED